MTEPTVVRHGTAPWRVLALHGGPAAVGDVAPLAARLGRRWGTLEPHQRGSSDRPLSVAIHVQDLHEIIEAECDAPPVLVGHSWGAMLALAYAAEHPEATAGLALIGCGTFTEASRQLFRRRRQERTTPELAEALERAAAIADPGRRFARYGALMNQVYGVDLVEIPEPPESPEDPESFDHRAHEETWSDMVRRQEKGDYPAQFSAIEVPAVLLHGDADPHPGEETWQDLRPGMPQLERVELERCGHSPWLERAAREPFFDRLEGWIEERLATGEVGLERSEG